jgi:hypothetical protein
VTEITADGVLEARLGSGGQNKGRSKGCALLPIAARQLVPVRSIVLRCSYICRVHEKTIEEGSGEKVRVVRLISDVPMSARQTRNPVSDLKSAAVTPRHFSEVAWKVHQGKGPRAASVKHAKMHPQTKTHRLNMNLEFVQNQKQLKSDAPLLMIFSRRREAYNCLNRTGAEGIL